MLASEGGFPHRRERRGTDFSPGHTAAVQALKQGTTSKTGLGVWSVTCVGVGVRGEGYTVK